MSFNRWWLDAIAHPDAGTQPCRVGQSGPRHPQPPGHLQGGVRTGSMLKSQTLHDSTCRTFSEPTTKMIKGVATRSWGSVGDGRRGKGMGPFIWARSSGKGTGQRGSLGWHDCQYPRYTWGHRTLPRRENSAVEHMRACAQTRRRHV